MYDITVLLLSTTLIFFIVKDILNNCKIIRNSGINLKIYKVLIKELVTDEELDKDIKLAVLSMTVVLSHLYISILKLVITLLTTYILIY